MKSIKRGRGPSLRSGIGGICAALFGIVWIIAASAMTQGTGVFGVIFPLFGVVFVIAAVAGAIYDFRNASAKDRFSEFDITDESEERDPLNARFGESPEKAGEAFGSDSPLEEPGAAVDAAFCPYCGVRVAEDFEYCPKCGKRLP